MGSSVDCASPGICIVKAVRTHRDFGSDGCPDEYENSEGGCYDAGELELADYISGTDPNNDNYNSDNNPDGTEGNSKYDSGENYDDYGEDRCPNEKEVLNLETNELNRF